MNGCPPFLPLHQQYQCIDGKTVTTAAVQKISDECTFRNFRDRVSVQFDVENVG